MGWAVVRGTFRGLWVLSGVVLMALAATATGACVLNGLGRTAESEAHDKKQAAIVDFRTVARVTDSSGGVWLHELSNTSVALPAST